MQEPPLITITDPRNPEGPADVLSSGSERPRLPRRVLVVGVALALLVGGTVFGVDRYRDHRAEVRAAAAAFALADTVHTRITLADSGVQGFSPDLFVIDAVTGEDQVAPRPTTGRLMVPLMVSDDADGFTEIRDVQVTGVGVTTGFDTSQLAGRVPGTTTPFELPVTIACSEVAAGRYPVLTSADVSLVPASGRVHRVSVPLTSTPELSLQACDLPDPSAVPKAAIEEQHGRLLVQIDSIPRSRLPLRALGVSSPGLALSLSGGRDAVIPPNTDVFYDVSVRVTDCAAARAGAGRVTLRLRSGERRWTVVATDSPAADFRRPGSTWLRRLVERACP